MRHTIMILGMTMAMGVSACGGSGGDDFGRFVGTWHPVSGTYTTNCPGYAPSTEPVTANLVWSTGVGADLISTDGSSCALMADVTNATASGVPGQSCTVPDSQGGTLTMAVSGYTFVVSTDGRTATENGSGQITYVGGGASVICTFTATASYQKIGNCTPDICDVCVRGPGSDLRAGPFVFVTKPARGGRR